jgi:hypothetical protein
MVAWCFNFAPDGWQCNALFFCLMAVQCFDVDALILCLMTAQCFNVAPDGGAML